MFKKSLFCLLLLVKSLAALEIPLDNLKQEKETTVVAFVDMDQILSSCQKLPEVQQKISDFQASYEKEEKELEEKITAREKEIAALSEEISVRESSSPVLSSDTTSVLNLPGVSEDRSQEIESKRKELADKESELQNLRQELARKKEQHRAELKNRQEQICNEKIIQVYEILKKVAAEEGIAVIVNKGNILYGPQHRDLTEKVLRMLEIK